MSAEAPWTGCLVCGNHEHPYTSHLNDVVVPEFVGGTVTRLRSLEMAGNEIHPLVVDVERLVDEEDGGRKAWAIWLLKLLQELEDASGASDVAAEIDAFLSGFAN